VETTPGATLSNLPRAKLADTALIRVLTVIEDEYLERGRRAKALSVDGDDSDLRNFGRGVLDVDEIRPDDLIKVRRVLLASSEGMQR
jgi:hypothetical protein